MSSKSPRNLVLAFSALGIVYGDIGTSPLYAFKESFHLAHNISVDPLNIFGVLSLIFWSLILIISLKYLVLIINADNHGEGGILALTALVSGYLKKTGHSLRFLTLLGLFGTALLYGDGIITPAISVLSAVEGLELVAPSLHPYVLPITVLILILLFAFQKHGTESVGKVFGPITLVWFITLGVLGFNQILLTPSILKAMNPYYAWHFFATNSWNGFVVLGSVFLVVTGGEALYSDLGHFGKTPIRMAWFSIVLPALVLNYFGQGALLLKHPEAIKNPFYLLAPEWALLPLVILATLATVIASQALITGVFSLTMQAAQLQYMPRVRISHTSEKEIGQIYVGSLNWVLMFSCILVVLTFKTSSNLASAYGVAVTTTMVITTILFYYVAFHCWNWNRFLALGVCSFFLVLELSFWGANLLKTAEGGWFPILVGIILYILMTTWKRGRQIVSSRMREIIQPLPEFVQRLKENPPTRVTGSAIYMTGQADYVPAPLIQGFKHYHCIHEKLIFLYVKTVSSPHVSLNQRAKCKSIDENIYMVILEFGFMDLPNVPEALKTLRMDGERFMLDDATFFIGRDNLIATKRKGMMIWREKLFALMSRNAHPATKYFYLPSDRVIEIGSFIEL